MITSYEIDTLNLLFEMSKQNVIGNFIIASRKQVHILNALFLAGSAFDFSVNSHVFFFTVTLIIIHRHKKKLLRIQAHIMLHVIGY